MDGHKVRMDELVTLPLAKLKLTVTKISMDFSPEPQ